MVWRWFALAAMTAFLLPPAHAFTLNVRGPQGEAVGGYRWLVEEDATKASIPGEPAVPGVNLSLSFHTSYMPVIAKGDASQSPPDVPAGRRYFVSVLPDSGYTIGAAPVVAGQETVTVVVNKLPLPTAQISVFIFNDNHPINNAPDLPEEEGLPNFSIQLFEAGGTYGQSGGQVSQDAFGNPLGTTYQEAPCPPGYSVPAGSGACVSDADGAPLVAQLGTGVLTTDADGVVRIKYLAPAKYTIFAVPPVSSDWHQTATIEGTKGVDAWVKANEPGYFAEFGPPGHHVFIGFVNRINDTTVLTGGSSITGKIVNLHTSRPPDIAFYSGQPIPDCWVGLNELPAAGGRGIYAQPCHADSTFAIPNVPPGQYQLVIWDEALDVIFASHDVTVPPGGGEVALLDVPVFNWFGKMGGSIFFDLNANGFRDTGEQGITGQAVNLRFRDGSIYQAATTKGDGSYEFEEIFPFFNWLVAEVDFARFKATGATVIVDDGGPVDPTDPWSYGGVLNPQPQAENGGAPYRTETGPVLLQGFQSFLGQTNVIHWGKQIYAAGQNGGVSGIVRYATTRAENDPRYAAPENWEPGIPRVQVNLYRDCNGDGIIDESSCTATSGLHATAAEVTFADVDQWPFENFPGVEDIDRNGNGTFDLGDAVDVATTDSWDDNLPADCQGANRMDSLADDACFDGLRNFNQVRPALFDGGYAFGGSAGKAELPAGVYIVEAVAPPGYEHQKEEDKNVDFGDSYVPSPLLLPPVCVGDAHTVPAELNLFPGVDAPFANQARPLCDRKQVILAQGQNAAADFFLFTEVPVAGHVTGMILDDLSNEFDPNAPNFGEKYAPPFLPVSFRDWTGREINRVYADQWGRFNALVPSTFTINQPMPSGVAPNMITACMNSPVMADPIQPGGYALDPFYNPRYSQFCYQFQYMPGKTTYLDTPVLPVAAFAAVEHFPLDCNSGEGTPAIYSVTGQQNVGPYVPTPIANGGPLRRYLTLRSMGAVEVPNPSYNIDPALGPVDARRTITRNFGFGNAPGSVRIGNTLLSFANCSPACSWSDDVIVVRVPAGTSTGQLSVTRGDNGKSTQIGVTVVIGNVAPIVVNPGGSIQAAIDGAAPGALITVAPGLYEEMPIMYKKIRLQGWGAGSTIINAAKFPSEKLQQWRSKLTSLVDADAFDLLPGQNAGPIDPRGNEPALFNTEEGAGITVLAQADPPPQCTGGGNWCANSASNHARIDGFTITGADQSGGIFVNGYADFLEISNNRIVGNNGFFGGGIRIGNPQLIDGTAYTDNRNRRLHIHNNQVTENGSIGNSGAGGISLYTGADNYQVNDNFICGNFTAGDGGGIGHAGRSDDGMILRNTIVFNQTFNQGRNASGGGVFIAGLPALAAGALSEGSGNVTLNGNLILGNIAGAGDGGGIRTQFVNGADVQDNPAQPNSWYRIHMINNGIVNNVAALAGGGISLQDTANIAIQHNTVANNDSTATAGEAFLPGSPNQSTPQPAGIVARAHSATLAAAFASSVPVALRTFSNPLLVDNIVWHNRSFYWAIDNIADPPTFGLVPDVGAGAPPVFDDLAVLGTATAMCLSPSASVISSLTGQDGCSYTGSGNNTADPNFAAEYFNGSPGQVIVQPEVTTSLATAPAFDEGGNWIDVHFGPLTLTDASGQRLGQYHLP